MARRDSGTGTITLVGNRWVARIYVGPRRISRKRRTREQAEAAIIEMIDLYRDEVGYFYAGTIDGLHHPELRRERPPRSGVTARVRWLVFERDGWRCVYCGADAQTSRLVADHRLAVADGGTDDIENLVTACQDCNVGKGDRPLKTVPPRLVPSG